MKEHHEYSWTSSVTGELITLALDIFADDDDWHPSIEGAVEPHGGTYRNSPIGLDTCGADGSGNLPLSWHDSNAGFKDIGIEIPTNILVKMSADIAAANAVHSSHMLTGANLRYNIHTTDDFGLPDGFDESMIENIVIIRIRTLTDNLLSHLDEILLGDILRRLNDSFRNSAQATYTPIPGQDWDEEYLEKVADRTAPGTAYFKASEVVAEIDRILADQLPVYIERIIEHYRQIVDREARDQKKCTSEQVAAAERQYNDIQNEGGEGQVPYMISADEATHAREKIAVGEKVLAKFKGISVSSDQMSDRTFG